MRGSIVAIISGAMLLAGCASSIMEGFIGQPLQVAVARYGPPEIVFDMPDGRRAFQWRMESQSVMPTRTVGTATTNIYAPPGAFGSAQTNFSQTTYGGQVMNRVCRYTMYARWNEGSNAWVFEGFEEPTFGCQ